MNARPRKGSLLAALVGRTGLVLLAVIFCVGIVAFFAAQWRVDKVYDDQLIIGANVLRALMSDELLTHPSIAKWDAPATDPTPFVRAMLAR